MDTSSLSWKAHSISSEAQGQPGDDTASTSHTQVPRQRRVQPPPNRAPGSLGYLFPVAVHFSDSGSGRGAVLCVGNPLSKHRHGVLPTLQLRIVDVRVLRSVPLDAADDAVDALQRRFALLNRRSQLCDKKNREQQRRRWRGSDKSKEDGTEIFISKTTAFAHIATRIAMRPLHAPVFSC